MHHQLIQFILRALCASVVCSSQAHAECTRQADGTWQCGPRPPQSVPNAQPTAMDIRVECPTSRGSGTAVARAASGGTLVVTNHHVVAGQASVTLHPTSGESVVAQIAAVDQQNDLVLLSVPTRWPIVNLGGDIAVGTAVQFRAFDAGVTFRKYYGQVTSEYRATGGAGGYFATGRSVAGNSGGGVYCDGRLVGVVWGNPNGGTALVPIGPVRRLIERVQSTPYSKPSSTDDSDERACDCDERWQLIEQRLADLAKPTTPPTATPPAPSIAPAPLDWLQIAAAALGVSTPIGAAILAAGLLARVRRNTSERGLGGPRDQPFRNASNYNTTEREPS